MEPAEKVMVVTPVITGPDWMEPGERLIVTGTTTKRAALKALRKAGHRVMHMGGDHTALCKSVESFYSGGFDTTTDQEDSREVYHALRRMGLDDDTDVLEWGITVHQ